MYWQGNPTALPAVRRPRRLACSQNCPPPPRLVDEPRYSYSKADSVKFQQYCPGEIYPCDYFLSMFQKDGGDGKQANQDYDKNNVDYRHKSEPPSMLAELVVLPKNKG
jgi:hypothetical protein